MSDKETKIKCLQNLIQNYEVCSFGEDNPEVAILLNKKEVKILKEIISDLQSMVHGTWIPDADDENQFLHNCSVCGYEIDTHEHCGFPPYCNHCGAKMDGDV